MVACANPAYKNEDLYALLERLKSHPKPSQVFSAVNNRREVNYSIHPKNVWFEHCLLFEICVFIVEIRTLRKNESDPNWQKAHLFSLRLIDFSQTALYLAASERRPLVAGYLAETMSALRIQLNQTYEKGNTLIHYLAIWGDEFNQVLSYLVRVRTPDDKLAFDLNARNHTGKIDGKKLADTLDCFFALIWLACIKKRVVS